MTVAIVGDLSLLFAVACVSGLITMEITSRAIGLLRRWFR